MQSFFKRRFDKSNFTGLPLTVIVLTLLLIVGTFVGLIDSVTNTSPIVSLDTSVTQYLFDRRTYNLNRFFFAVTQFGSFPIVITLIIGILISFYLYKKKEYIIPFIATILGTEVAVFLIKTAIHRQRPGESLAYYIEKSFSFPSGHASISMALYGFLAYFFLRIAYKNVWAHILSRICIVMIILIGFSRIYLGVHYLSDVLGGYLVGGLWLLMGISLKEIVSWRQAKNILS